MTWLLIVPAVIVLLLLLWLRSEIASPEESRRYSRIDLQIRADERERRRR